MRCGIVNPVSIFLTFAALVGADSTIDHQQKYAWHENIGWTNWHDANAGAQGVNAGSAYLSGYIWAENVGFINVGNGGGPYANTDDTNFGVNINPDRTLAGLAWGENVGWINFDGGALASPPKPALLTPCGQFGGFVWCENAGWLRLACAEKVVLLEGQPIRCDLNDDRLVNGLDVQPFVDLLLNGDSDARDVCAGDLEQPPDNVIDFDDVEPFVACLLRCCN